MKGFIVILFILIAFAGIYMHSSKPGEGTGIPEAKGSGPAGINTERLDNFRSSIRQKIRESSFANAFEEIRMLFDELDQNFVDSSDIELLVSFFESLPWDFYKALSTTRNSIKNKHLGNTFDFFYQLASFLKDGNLNWKNFIATLEFDVRPLVFLSQKWFYDIAVKRKELKDGNDKKILGIFIHMYLIEKDKVRKSIEGVQLTNEMKKKLMNIYSVVNAYSYYNQSSGTKNHPEEGLTKNKAVTPKEFSRAISFARENNLPAAMVEYIKAFVKEPGIVLLDDEKLRDRATDKFLKLFYDGEDNTEEMLLFVGFIHFIHRNSKEARPLLGSVKEVKKKKIADILLQMSDQPGISQILNNIDRSKYIMKIGGLNLRRKIASVAVESVPEVPGRPQGGTDNKILAGLQKQKDTLLSQGKYNEAIDVLKKMNEIEEKSSFLIEMANAYEKIGMQTYSIDVLEKAVRIDPELPGLQVRLADLCYDQKDIKRAKLHYGSALFNEVSPELLKKCREKVLELNKVH